MQSFFVQKKTVIIEGVILVMFLAGMYYAYTLFSTGDTVTSPSSANQNLLGQNFVLFLKAVNQDKLSFKNLSFLDSELAKQLVDHSEIIGTTTSRGRVDPFEPYAATRPLR
jgi:hypothetical protein